MQKENKVLSVHGVCQHHRIERAANCIAGYEKHSAFMTDVSASVQPTATKLALHASQLL
jgi:hypothetical protein